MALGSGPGASGHVRGRRRAKKRPLSEINVTPLVDVMLVLLIIFMISAPLLTVGVPLELPRTDASAISTDNEPISVSVERSGAIYVDQDPATLDQLGPRVAAIAGAGVTDRPIFVRADGAASYEAVARVMARLSASGFSKINLVTDTVPTGAISAPVESEG